MKELGEFLEAVANWLTMALLGMWGWNHGTLILWPSLPIMTYGTALMVFLLIGAVGHYFQDDITRTLKRDKP